MTLKFNGERVFRVGQKIAHEFKPIKPTKKEDDVNAREKKELKEFAQSAIERFNDQKREERLRDRPNPPPLVTLEERLRGGSNLPPLLLPAQTETRKMIEKHYKTNEVRSESGRVAFEPPPCIMAPLEEEK